MKTMKERIKQENRLEKEYLKAQENKADTKPLQEEKEKVDVEQGKRTIQDAIAHLNGYALVVKARTGYNPIAVDDCIKELKRLIKWINI